MKVDSSASKKLALCSRAIALMLIGNGLHAQLVTMSLGLDHSSVTQGVSFTATVRVSGLSSDTTPSLGTFDFDIDYNPAAIRPSAISFGDPVFGDQLNLSGFGSITSNSTLPGSLNLFELSLDSISVLDDMQRGDFDLAEVTFNTLTVGLVNLNYSNVVLGDALGNPLDVDAVGASLLIQPPRQITVVPEPSTFGFWAVCLLVILPVFFSRPFRGQKAQVEP
jgi:hypothetical protein